MKKIYLTILSAILLISSSNLFAKDIPVIVIAPGKNIQSKSTVGTNVTVISGDTIRSSSDNFLGNIIDGNSTSTNTFQMGGHGTNMGIQLRGLEKRYSTVYIDGVKMSDPATPDNSFYFQHIMKDSIERVEILKGNQSTLYGSNAIGGTKHIFTKKGKEGHRSTTKVSAGSNKTTNAYYSVDGANDKIDYYLGLNRFLTSGISARNDDGESDQYRNKSLTANFGYTFNENLKIENSLRVRNTDLKYDAVAPSSTDLNDRSDDITGNYSLRIIQDAGKNNNTLSYNKLQSVRKTTETGNTKQNYFGYRDAVNWTGTYNFDLDNRIVYGAEGEFDAAKYLGDYAPSQKGWKKSQFDKYTDESIVSQFFDYQFRPLEKLYTTFGLRSDKHSTVGRKTSGRTTLAYRLDNISTIRSSWGTGVRFPALYDIHYGTGNTNTSGGGSYSGDGYNNVTADDLKSERANSFDVGYETYLENLGLDFDVNYFNIEIKNPLNGDMRNNWKVNNTNGVNTSKGIELGLGYSPDDKKYAIDFGYTFTDSYDSNTCDSQIVGSNRGCGLEGDALGTAKVRVPKNAFSSSISHKTYPGVTNTLGLKFMGERRDFGNNANGFADVVLEDYMTLDFTTNYRCFNTYDLTFRAGNIFNDVYEEAHMYSTQGRTFNIGLNRVY